MKKLNPAFAGITWLLCLFSVMAFAQTGLTVSGLVKDEKGQPLKGVNVTIKGSAAGTSTDANGKFSLHVPGRESVLVFSFVGYDPQELKADKDVLDVTFNLAASQLNDVVAPVSEPHDEAGALDGTMVGVPLCAADPVALKLPVNVVAAPDGRVNVDVPDVERGHVQVTGDVPVVVML